MSDKNIHAEKRADTIPIAAAGYHQVRPGKMRACDLLPDLGMATPEFSGLTDTARKILDYFQDHKDGLDTLEGIAEWWIFERNLVQGLEETRDALHELLQHGLVETVKEGDRMQYRLKQRP